MKNSLFADPPAKTAKTAKQTIESVRASLATAPRRLWWIRYPADRELSVSRTPPATLAEIHVDYPSAEVQPEPARDANRPLSRNALFIANAYLDHLGESDPITRAEYLDGLARDPERYAQHCRAVVDVGLARQEVAA